MTEHTPTPWAYRPRLHDDWGWIRDANGHLAALARDGNVLSDQFDKYRAAGTDPYEANAAFIVKAVNNHDALTMALWNLCAACERHGMESSPFVVAARKALSAAVGQTGSRS